MSQLLTPRAESGIIPARMDLNLETAAPAPEFVRNLTLEDLKLDAPPALPAAQRLAKIRDVHHALARCIASGMTNNEAAAVTGYSHVRISILNSDPAFKELVSSYRKDINDKWADLGAKMTSFQSDLIDELRERFETEPEKFSNNFIHETIKTFADRTGFGPKTTQVNVNIDLAERLKRARELAEGALAAGPSAETGGRTTLLVGSPPLDVIDLEVLRIPEEGLKESLP